MRSRIGVLLGGAALVGGSFALPAALGTSVAHAEGADCADSNATYCPTISLSASETAAGSQITVTGANYMAAAKVDIQLHSTPVDFGDVTADANGGFTAQLTIPSATTTGAHEIVGTDTAIPADTATADLTVDAATTTATESGVGSTVSSPASSGGGSLASTGMDILMGLLAAALLILLGTAITIAARRRQQQA